MQRACQHHLALQQSQKERKDDLAAYQEAHAERTLTGLPLVSSIEHRYERRLYELRHPKKPWKWKINASKHISSLLQALGVGLTQQTKSGQISTKKDVLEGLVDVPVVRDILTFRENDKLLSVFVWQIFDRWNSDGQQIQHGYADDNDRIHPIWTVHKITGRWASSEPVVSNVPKDKFKRLADGSIKITRPNLRKQIVAPHGRIFVGFDFSQLEARIIALISGDPFLCQVFAEGKDIHRECAKVIFTGFEQLPEKDQKKSRDETKSLEYGAFYGGSVETLWKQMLKEGRNVKLVDVAKSIQILMNKVSGVIRWQRETVARASLPPYEVRDFLLGRRRTFPLGQVEATEAINYGCQSAGASIMNTGMARMDDALKKYKQAFAVVQIHDAAVFECWADDAPKLAEDVVRCFHQEYERDGRLIPFPVETKIGQSWADV